MKDKLFDYVERDNWVFNLSGVTKLICFLLLSASVMFTYVTPKTVNPAACRAAVSAANPGYSGA